MLSAKLSGIAPVQGAPAISTRLSRPQTPSRVPTRLALVDQLSLSPDALALNRLLRMWGAVSTLFGINAPTSPGLDLAGLRQALAEARIAAQKAQERQKIINTLQTSVLAQAEALVEKYYGLRGDGALLQVVLDEETGDALAFLSYLYDRQGRMVNQQLHVSIAQFTPDTGPDGVNGHVIQNDRIIAHEMAHAIMGRNMDVAALPDWFMEGTAEYIAGGAERVSLALKAYSPQGLVSRLRRPWEGDSSQYAAAYLAVRFLNEATEGGGGLKAVMAHLKAGDSLDRAITAVSSGAFAGVTGLFDAFVEGGLGAAFIRNIDTSGRDPGSIKPGGGPNIVPDQGFRSTQPLKGFRVAWPSPLVGLTVGGLTPWFGMVPTSTAVAAYRRQMAG